MRGLLIRRCVRGASFLALILAMLICAPLAHADTLADRAAQLSDAAFVMLNSLNSAAADKYSGGPLLAPAADLASNAQSLASALKSGDTVGARHAMAAIIHDQATIEPGMKGASPVILAEWGSLKTQIAMVQKDVPPEEGPPPAPVAAESPSAEAPPVESEPAAPEASVAPTLRSRAPRVVIESRTVNDDGTMSVHGFLEGTDLKDAGIYLGPRKLKDIEVASVRGEQRLNFTFKIESPEPGETISTTDINGREASAAIVAGSAPVSGAPEAGLAPEADEAPTIGDTDSSTAEISPSGGPELSPEPTRRLTELGNVQINIVALRRSPTAPNAYEVSGRIVGNVSRAGIFANGRMIRQIALMPGGVSTFDVTFSRLGRQNISIRAYGPGSDFVEQPLEPGAGITMYGGRPLYPSGAAP